MRPQFPALALWLLAAALPLSAVERGSLLPVERPNLEQMETAVRDQLTQMADTLDAMLSRPDTPGKELGEAFGYMGQLYVLYGLFDAAEPAFRNARALLAEDFRWPYYLATIYQETRRLEEARAMLEEALRKRPRDLPTMIRLGQILTELDRLDEAERWFDQVLSLVPVSPGAHYGLGVIAERRDDPESAITHFEAALRAQPQATAVHYRLGVAYRNLGEADRAKENFDKRGDVEVRFLDPLVEDLAQLAAGAGVHVVRATRAFARGDVETAIESYRKAIEADPENLTARQALASALARSGDIESALAEYREVEQRDPDNPVGLYNIGTLLAGSGDLEGAISRFERAVELAPDFADAHVNLATALIAAGRAADALPHLERAVELRPEDGEARVELARLEITLDRLDSAERHLSMVLAADPKQVEAAKALADLLGRTRRFSAAADAFAAVAELEPDNPTVRFALATSLLLAGREADARDRLEAAVERFDDDVALRHLLARLLATASDGEVRDGERALQLANSVFAAQPIVEHAATVAMALAEAGRTEEAAELQRRLIRQVREVGDAELEAELAAALALYEVGSAPRAPWRPGGTGGS